MFVPTIIRRIFRGGRLLFGLFIMTIFIGANCMAVSGAWMSGRMSWDEPQGAQSASDVRTVEHTSVRGIQAPPPQESGHTGSLIAIVAVLSVLVAAGGVAAYSMTSAEPVGDDDL